MPASPVVLVAEDNAELRQVLKDTLVAEGYEVLTARDEAEAQERLRVTRVDLLISDLSDTRRGYQSLDELRQEFPNLPVIALSDAAGEHPSLFFAAWQAPHLYFSLPKPFKLGDVLAATRHLLRTA